MGRPRLGLLPHLLVERPHREGRLHPGALGRLRQQVDIPQDQRRLGEDGERVPGPREHLDDPPGEPIFALTPLVWIGICPHGYLLFTPLWRRHLSSRSFYSIDLDHDLAVEVFAHVEVKIFMGGASEAIFARMTASSIHINGKAEGDVGGGGDLVDDPLGADVEELEAAELAMAGVPAGGLVEEALLAGVLLLGQAPTQLGSLGPAHAGEAIRTYV
jgi:hypothetical protein